MFNSVSGYPLLSVVARSSIVLLLDIRGVNDMRQLVSYSRSTRSKLGQHSTRISSARTRDQLGIITSRVELPNTRLEKLVRYSIFFI